MTLLLEIMFSESTTTFKVIPWSGAQLCVHVCAFQIVALFNIVRHFRYPLNVSHWLHHGKTAILHLAFRQTDGQTVTHTYTHTHIRHQWTYYDLSAQQWVQFKQSCLSKFPMTSWHTHGHINTHINIQLQPHPPVLHLLLLLSFSSHT